MNHTEVNYREREWSGQRHQYPLLLFTAAGILLLGFEIVSIRVTLSNIFHSVYLMTFVQDYS
jgi:tmRNA-binding protein